MISNLSVVLLEDYQDMSDLAGSTVQDCGLLLGLLATVMSTLIAGIEYVLLFEVHMSAGQAAVMCGTLYLFHQARLKWGHA